MATYYLFTMLTTRGPNDDLPARYSIKKFSLDDNEEQEMLYGGFGTILAIQAMITRLLLIGEPVFVQLNADPIRNAIEVYPNLLDILDE